MTTVMKLSSRAPVALAWALCGCATIQPYIPFVGGAFEPQHVCDTEACGVGDKQFTNMLVNRKPPIRLDIRDGEHLEYLGQQFEDSAVAPDRVVACKVQVLAEDYRERTVVARRTVDWDLVDTWALGPAITGQIEQTVMQILTRDQQKLKTQDEQRRVEIEKLREKILAARQSAEADAKTRVAAGLPPEAHSRSASESQTAPRGSQNTNGESQRNGSETNGETTDASKSKRKLSRRERRRQRRLARRRARRKARKEARKEARAKARQKGQKQNANEGSKEALAAQEAAQREGLAPPALGKEPKEPISAKAQGETQGETSSESEVDPLLLQPLPALPPPLALPPLPTAERVRDAITQGFRDTAVKLREGKAVYQLVNMKIKVPKISELKNKCGAEGLVYEIAVANLVEATAAGDIAAHAAETLGASLQLTPEQIGELTLRVSQIFNESIERHYAAQSILTAVGWAG